MLNTSLSALWCNCLKVTCEGFSSVVFSQGATKARTGQCCKRCIGQSALHQTVRSYCGAGQSVLPIWKFFHLHWCAGYCWFWWVYGQGVSNLCQVGKRGGEGLGVLQTSRLLPDPVHCISSSFPFFQGLLPLSLFRFQNIKLFCIISPVSHPFSTFSFPTLSSPICLTPPSLFSQNPTPLTSPTN